jgi:hypothetical protein
MTPNWNASYLSIVQEVRRHGETVDTRLGFTKEVRDVALRWPCGVLVHRGGINYRLGWAEVLQVLAGVFDPELLRRVAPKADHSLFTEQMAYGPRVAPRMPQIIEALRVDPKSRQAVLYIADPQATGTPSLACTLSIQFLVRSGQLHATVYMRSWDLIKGLPYDLMMFSAIQQATARCLNLPEGELTVHAGSAHVYDSDESRVPTLKQAWWSLPYKFPGAWRNDRLDWIDVESWAAAALGGKWTEDGGNGIPDGIKVVDHNQMVRRLVKGVG